MMMREEVWRLASGLFSYYILRSTSSSIKSKGEEHELMAKKKQEKRSTAYRAYHIANCQLSQQQTSSPKQIPGVNNQYFTNIYSYSYTIYNICKQISYFYNISRTTVIQAGHTALDQSRLERLEIGDLRGNKLK